ncbi:MAG: hypothetical protein KC503_15520 [Myxococcales bacterium]|nr:hypothetical protein [Myxococcales bacterium]
MAAALRIEAIQAPLARPGEALALVAVLRCREAVSLLTAEAVVAGDEIGRGWLRGSLPRVHQSFVVAVPSRLERGTHELPFTLQLPHGLTPTYAGRYYDVRYRVTLIVREAQGRSCQASAPITVTRADDDALGFAPLSSGKPPYPGGVSIAMALPRGYGVAGGVLEVDVALRGELFARTHVSAIELSLTAHERSRRPPSRFLRRQPQQRGTRHAVLAAMRWRHAAWPLHSGEPLTFRLGIPDDAQPSVAGECVRTDWTLAARVVGRHVDARCEVELPMLAHPPGRRPSPPRNAPPNIGEASALARWQTTASQLALRYENNRLVGALGNTHCQVQREQRDGVFLVARIAFASLGIGLRVRPHASNLAGRLVGATLGGSELDRKHAVSSRFPAQARAFLSRLPGLLSTLIDHVEGGDEGLALLVRERDSPQALNRLAAIAREVVDGLDGARAAMPPPPMFSAAAVAAWRALAGRLDPATFERGPMSLHAVVAGHDCAVVTEWHGHRPHATRVSLSPRRAPGASYRVSVEAGGALDIPQLPRAARELAARLLDGAQRLSIDASGLTLELPAPLEDPASVFERLMAMEKLYSALRPGAGPFR